MPLIVHKRDGKYRLINKDTGRIEKTKNGKAIDGGGHLTKEKAQRQIRAIYYSKSIKK